MKVSKKLYQELSSLEYDLTHGELEHAQWHIKDMLRRMKPETAQQQYFTVWSIHRSDVASALRDEDDIEPEWPYDLTDNQMETIADRMVRWLEYSMDDYWNALRDATDDVVNRKFIQVREAK